MTYRTYSPLTTDNYSPLASQFCFGFLAAEPSASLSYLREF
jgi:hypothetical protein